MFEIQGLSFKKDSPDSPSHDKRERKPPIHVLPNLKAGDAGIVERIAADRGAAKRLADLGFVHGARLEMVRPGAPCIVRIGGTCVGLGRLHQASIQLTSA